MTSSGANRRAVARWGRWITPLLISFGLVLPVLIMLRGPLLQDLGEWVYEARVGAWLVTTGDTSRFTVTPAPVPYVTAQALLTGLAVMLQPSLAGVAGILITITLGSLAVGALIKEHRLPPLSAGVLLTLVVVLTSCFWNGYLGHQIGLALICAYLALPRTLRTHPAIVAGVTVAGFFTHGMTWAALGVIAGAHGLVDRRLAQVAVGSLPSLGLLAWFVTSAASSSGDGELEVDGPLQLAVYKAYTLAKMGGYQNLFVNGSGDGRALMLTGAAANCAFVAAFAALAVAAIVTATRSRSWRPELLAGLILLGVALVMPPSLVEIVNPGERLLSPSAICIAVAALAGGQHRMLGRAAATAAGLGLLLTAGSVALLPTKAAAGDPDHRDPTAGQASDATDRAGVLFQHRLDQYESRVAAADASWRAKASPIEPLIFKTTNLVNVTRPDLER